MLRFFRAAARYVCFGALASFAITPAGAQQTEVARGAQWLLAQVQPGGTLLNEQQSIAIPFQSRTEAARALWQVAATPAALIAGIGGETEDNTEYLARQIITLSGAGHDVAAPLAKIAARQNSDGGFGGAGGFASDALDTAWALLALDAAGGNHASAVSAAVDYLLSAQDASGGYPQYRHSPDPYLSALVVAALQRSSRSPAALNAINAATTWLLAQQHADGSWGGVAETSIVYLALLGVSVDSGLIERVTAYLVSQQAADGSWGADPYVTALALLALTAKPVVVPSTGDVVAQVLDNALGQPLAGASVALQEVPNVVAVSDAAGNITFAALAAGTYTLVVSAPGYASQAAKFTLYAGTTTNLGVIKMPPAPTTGILQGIIKDSSTGAGLGDVSVSVTGSANATITTAADGRYRLVGLIPGAVMVSASKDGYASVGGTGTITAGSILIFSPTLIPADRPAATVGNVTGQVVDSATQAPLAGATITLGAGNKTAVAGGDGRFSITDVSPGTYSLTVHVPGYTEGAIPAVLVSAGSTTDLQVLGLGKALTGVVLVGKVTDRQSGAPIAGAVVTALGTAASAVADNTGGYRLDGLATGPATLRFGASGYTSEVVATSFSSAGQFRLDQALAVDHGTNPRFVALATDQPSYPAYTPVSILMHLENTGTAAISDAVVDITIVDAQGQVVHTQDATRLDPDGVAQNQFTFLPGTTTAVDAKWSTQAYAPGTYTIRARVFTDISSTGARTMLAEREAPFTIAPSQAILRLSVAPLPAFTTLGASEQLRFKVEATHHSNQPLNVAFKYQFVSPAGVVLKEDVGTISLQPHEIVGSVVLGPFPYQFAASGVYPVQLTSTGDIVPHAVANGEVQVAPGIRVEPTQSIAPATVTPDGDKRIRIDLHLKGVEQK